MSTHWARVDQVVKRDMLAGEMNGGSEAVRVRFLTFGCRVNQYETGMMHARLAKRYTVVDGRADVYVVNGCTVTALADRKARQAIHRLRRENPEAKIILIGCLGDAVRQGLSRVDGVDLIAGNAWKPRIEEVIARARAGETGIIPDAAPLPLEVERSAGPDGRVRAFLKVQDGCDLACAFCRTTQVRGPSRSKPIAAAVAEAEGLVAAGYPEIVLTGINLAQYAAPDGDLGRLVREVLSISGLRRLRLGSINPYGITPSLLEAFAADTRACPHFHIPLQSGDDRVLKAMKRGYTVDLYRSRIELVRRFVPAATFGADVIVGFPGEDEAAFQNTCSLIEEIEFANLHIFRYSPRRGTPAAALPGRVPEPVKRARAEAVGRLQRTVQARVLERFVGKEEPVLIEERKDGAWRGYTRGYIDTYVTGEFPVGSEVPVRITDVRTGHLQGVKED
ncbi:tRNA (N(6)-L-threonylcarbamoyladenosine(37)-C(2))-methylthiotransferase MtaB [Candidatus Acetothermia bacterium]|nr:MAG: tRNA (N(6)-L-threonylcarbamoyladenosine(37)-C(2))-methylthiotransferase MtaB [Candidatus Acetothermia bacterium]